MRKGVCKNILYSNALDMISKGNVTVIDVREEKELISNNKIIPGSINIPVNDLTSKIKDVVPDMNKPIIVYCSSGSRSIFACQILSDFGYNKVYNLYGGIK